MQTLRADLTPSIESLSTVTLPGRTIWIDSHDRGFDVHAVLPGNPIGTEQCVFVAHDRTLGWASEQNAVIRLWRELVADEFPGLGFCRGELPDLAFNGNDPVCRILARCGDRAWNLALRYTDMSPADMTLEPLANHAGLRQRLAEHLPVTHPLMRLLADDAHEDVAIVARERMQPQKPQLKPINVRDFQGGYVSLPATSWCLEYRGGDLPRGADVDLVVYTDEATARAALDNIGGERGTYQYTGEEPVPCVVTDTAPNRIDTCRVELRPAEYYRRGHEHRDFAVRFAGAS